MKKSILFAGSNIRRSKGQTAALAVLAFLAALMLNLWLMLATDYKQNFDRCHDRLNAEHARNPFTFILRLHSSPVPALWDCNNL